MDFDLRQWLLILGPIFIVGVLLHGYFRMRSGQNDIKMKLDKTYLSQPGEEATIDELSLVKAELPNGGARVRTAEDLHADRDDVPVLMESVDLPSMSADTQGERHVERVQAALSEQIALSDEAALSEAAPLSEETAESEEASTVDPVQPERLASSEPQAKAPPARRAAVDAGQAEQASDAEPAGEKPEKFVVMYVLALDAPFPGQGLADLLVEGGMAFGEMDIFHQLDPLGTQLFSLASAVEPGTFDMSALDQFSTPGVTLFMRVHELSEPLPVFESMLSVAELIAQDLNGEVRDETRSVMTPQTIEHCRQSITEFQFKYSA